MTIFTDLLISCPCIPASDTSTLSTPVFSVFPLLIRLPYLLPFPLYSRFSYVYPIYSRDAEGSWMREITRVPVINRNYGIQALEVADFISRDYYIRDVADQLGCDVGKKKCTRQDLQYSNKVSQTLGYLVCKY